MASEHGGGGEGAGADEADEWKEPQRMSAAAKVAAAVAAEELMAALVPGIGAGAAGATASGTAAAPSSAAARARSSASLRSLLCCRREVAASSISARWRARRIALEREALDAAASSCIFASRSASVAPPSAAWMNHVLYLSRRASAACLRADLGFEPRETGAFQLKDIV